jgi:hypothetical protein
VMLFTNPPAPKIFLVTNTEIKKVMTAVLIN